MKRIIKIMLKKASLSQKWLKLIENSNSKLLILLIVYINYKIILFFIFYLYRASRSKLPLPTPLPLSLTRPPIILIIFQNISIINNLTFLFCDNSVIILIIEHYLNIIFHTFFIFNNLQQRSFPYSRTLHSVNGNTDHTARPFTSKSLTSIPFTMWAYCCLHRLLG